MFPFPAPVPGAPGGGRVAVGVAHSAQLCVWKPGGMLVWAVRAAAAPSGRTIAGSGARAAAAGAIVRPGTSPAPCSTSPVTAS